jgi:hypothetical protein
MPALHSRRLQEDLLAIEAEEQALRNLSAFKVRTVLALHKRSELPSPTCVSRPLLDLCCCRFKAWFGFERRRTLRPHFGCAAGCVVRRRPLVRWPPPGQRCPCLWPPQPFPLPPSLHPHPSSSPRRQQPLERQLGLPTLRPLVRGRKGPMQLWQRRAAAPSCEVCL